MKDLIASSFLDSQKILEYYYYKGVPESKKLDSLHFSELYTVAQFQPDYLIKNAKRKIFGDVDSSVTQKLDSALRWLATPLEFRGNLLYVKREDFGKWQEIILSISPLTLVVRKLFEKSNDTLLWDVDKYIDRHLVRTAIPSVYEPAVEGLVKHQRLADCHVHLNGSTEPDVVWIDALRSPAEFHIYLKNSLYSEASQYIDEQYLQLGRFDQNDVYRLLLIANKLRHDIINKTFDELPQRYSMLSEQVAYISDDSINHKNELQDEALFLMKAYHDLCNDPCINHAYWFHYYILIRSFFHKLLVQQKPQVGFDQFQKITFNELREKKESAYHLRFRQMQGMHTSALGRLEARFAPKITRKKLDILANAICNGYTDDIRDEFSLSLVPHFIKQPDTRSADTIITFRDLHLRLKNSQALDVLLNSIDSKSFKSLRKYIVGFDAASNELDAGAEVFSPIFRKLSDKGFANFTYHVGEDFVHLISGIRAVFEAVTFLDLKPGNRIGHGTSLGIEPSMWQKRVGKSIFIEQGEWFDNLIFTYYLCRRESDLAYICPQLEQAIQELFVKIYAVGECVPIQAMIDAWFLRKFDPLIVFKWRPVGVFDSFAAQELRSYERNSLQARSLFERYHSASVIKRSKKIIEIAANEPFTASEMRKMQSSMIKLLNNRRISIESLISSNVRISHYKDYMEHHIVRWLGLNNDNEPRPTVVLGTDDTGIFMTNIYNEYVHALHCIEARTDRKHAEELLRQLATDSVGGLFTHCGIDDGVQTRCAAEEWTWGADLGKK